MSSSTASSPSGEDVEQQQQPPPLSSTRPLIKMIFPPDEEYSEQELSDAYDEFERLDREHDDVRDAMYELQDQLSEYQSRMIGKNIEIKIIERKDGTKLIKKYQQPYVTEKVAVGLRLGKRIRVQIARLYELQQQRNAAHDKANTINIARRAYKRKMQQYIMEQFDYSEKSSILDYSSSSSSSHQEHCVISINNVDVMCE